METYQQERFEDLGIHCKFVQDNLSHSYRGVLRGLHYQHPHPQAKLVQVLAGEMFDVVVDIRRGSASFGKWTGAILSEKTTTCCTFLKALPMAFVVSVKDLWFTISAAISIRRRAKEESFGQILI
jgi:dTDP-4-dehydrorhamnose 3,5-epimerase